MLFLGNHLQLQTSVQSEITNDPLNRIDTDSAVKIDPVAATFAWVWANTTANRRERTGVGVALPRFGERLVFGLLQPLGLSDPGQPISNAITAGARVLARWFFGNVLGSQRRLFSPTTTARRTIISLLLLFLGSLYSH
jgi:hypothetical protein